MHIIPCCIVQYTIMYVNILNNNCYYNAHITVQTWCASRDISSCNFISCMSIMYNLLHMLASLSAHTLQNEKIIIIAIALNKL